MWSCLHCTYSNPSESIFCEVCSQPNHQPPPSHKACPQCTFFNSLPAIQCLSCDYLFIDTCMTSLDSSSAPPPTKRKRDIVEGAMIERKELAHSSDQKMDSYDQFIELISERIQLQPETTYRLCGSLSFISQLNNHEGKDTRGWGCGYRNIQMLCTYMIRSPPPFFSDSLVLQHWDSVLASTTGIQQTLMNAWKSGYDTCGAGLLNWDIVNTRKWIGATGI